MNRSELIRALAEKTQITQEKAGQTIDSLIETITENLKKGEDVSIVGFGSFKTTKRAERQGRNPRTGDAITISASVVPSFSAGKTLKDAVNS